MAVVQNLFYSSRMGPYTANQPRVLAGLPSGPPAPAGAPLASDRSTPQDVFTDSIVQLAALCPLCALAALSPEAAIAALSPTLRTFNPAINPRAALLAFSGYNPGRYQRGRIGR